MSGDERGGRRHGEDVGPDAIPDVRDGLTRIERVVLLVLAETQKELGGRNVPMPMLYGRVVERIDALEGRGDGHRSEARGPSGLRQDFRRNAELHDEIPAAGVRLIARRNDLEGGMATSRRRSDLRGRVATCEAA